MPLSSERLHEIVIELASRPQHEKVRSLVFELLVHGLDAKSTELDFERRVPEVHGRIDALLGRTLFEFKSDLRREQRDAESKLPDYLTQREKETKSHFIGLEQASTVHTRVRHLLVSLLLYGFSMHGDLLKKYHRYFRYHRAYYSLKLKLKDMILIKDVYQLQYWLRRVSCQRGMPQLNKAVNI
jgi:hypothetical protein